LIGQTLSHFRITAKLGEGGMGEVYRAEDTNLKREVAIKVLPEAFVQDPERFARFEREAHVLASLNHPNIAAIHDLAEDQGTHFLVLELVEGEDLATRLARGPIPVEDALPLALQIAEGLEAAHKQGIVHRDLKPANVMVNPDGKVKVLDFGLAKPTEAAASGDGELTRSPTLTAQMTQAGVILGTAAYMSPEQARGLEVDKQADIWAFGCVVFEMLAGKRVFAGADVTDSLAAVLRSDPEWPLLPAATPRSVRRLLRRCLEKDTHERLRDIGDARLELEDTTVEEADGEPAATMGRQPSRWALAIPWGLAAVAGVALLLTLSGLNESTAPQGATTRLLIETGPLDLSGRAPAIALSRDGRRLAFVGYRDNASYIAIREFDEFDAQEVPGTVGAQGPFFSPDGEHLGFTVEGELRTVSLAGGPVTTLFSGWVLWGATWGPQDRIVFGAWPNNTGLTEVAAVGAGTRRVTELDAAYTENYHAQPEFIGDSNAVLFNSFNAFTAVGVPGVMVSSPQSPPRLLLEGGGTNPRYAQSGHLVLVKNGSLMAAPFDPDSLSPTSGAVPVLQDIMTLGHRTAQYAIADNGTLAYVAGGRRAVEHTLVRVDRNGGSVAVTDTRRAYWGPRISPDGARLAFWLSGDNPQVWVLEVARGSLTRLTSEGASFWPIWTPEGDEIAFSHRQEESLVNVFQKDLAGNRPKERLTNSEWADQASAWSPDGRLLVFQEGIDPLTGFDIWVHDLEQQAAHPLLDTEANEFQPALSADGEWLAYVSDESGRREIYVARFPEMTQRTAISVDGGSEPVWNPQGGELFFRKDDRMMVVEFSTGPKPKVGRSRMLFEGRFVPGTPYGRNYDISPDGKSFVMITSTEMSSPPSQIHVILNWFNELERLVPTP
jgi:Tol biopolymer transport system component